MTARLVEGSPAKLLLAVALLLAGCYDVPKPACGFRCGPAAECPADYTCGPDFHCRLNGSSPSLVCAMPDAAPIPDAYSPAVTSTSPVSGSTVNPATPIRASFDVDVTGVTPSSFTVTMTGSGLFVVGDVSYDPTSRTATFARVEGLPPNQQLTATLTADISDPLSGRPLMPTTITFTTTQDTTAPQVLFTNPTNGSTGVSVAANVTFRFSEPVQNVDATTVTVIETASMVAVTGTVTYDGATRTATFDPQDQLTPNLSYQGRVSSGVTDLAGNALTPNPFITGFMTGADTVAPVVRLTSPANMDANVAVNSNIVVTFDEPVANVDTTSFQVNAGAVAGTVTMSNGNRTATFDPTADLPAASTINVTLSTAITDTSGNALAAFAFAFTTN